MKNNFYLKQCNYALSLPSRERGLKFAVLESLTIEKHVAPFTGAWIEILMTLTICLDLLSRSLHGSVD